MHSEKVMAKKSKPPVKVEKAVVKEETVAVKEETTVLGKEGEGIDAIRILMAVGELLILIDVGVILLRYVYHADLPIMILS